ncbi:gliding motility-associated C-terminal domain-containing protein [Agriterribacter sp.]|uniref:gliding motility-associated C-terminal domain-containing protein n=1 Tax=Agriterribacter sp. TaxID=2821509 RepID=UPI002B9B24E0|nr:gliding motility-associated C-terminal domain-containing protein [Agriterribacter sp.]HRO45528.1 gliding motility-associated C-terminal domain-containing protein [Agriterribacter sp.]HRQ17950.1 gliding motility-associated C-terminal domain-containing protein [Agriterribacter sp.]
MRNQFLIVSLVACAQFAFAGIRPQKTREMHGSPVIANNRNGNNSFTGQSKAQNVSWAAIGNNTIGSDQSICQHTAPAALTGSAPTGGNGSFTFQWQSSTTSATTGFSNINDATNQGYAPGALSQTHWYRRIVNSGAESNTSAAVQIETDPLPEVTISYDQSPYCGTGTATVTLTGLSGGTYSSASGLSINAATGAVNLSASTPGSYTVNYTFSSGACTSTATTNIDVGDPLLVITNPLPVCGSPTADITDPSITSGSTSGLTYHYFTDEAGTLPLSAPTAVAVSDTFYIRGISAGGCSTNLAPVIVVLNDQPVISTSDTVVACKGLPVTLKASSPGNEITWQNTGTGDSIVVQPAGNAIYKAIAINEAGCTDTAIVNVLVREFSVSLKANPNPMLVGSPATLTTSASSTYEVIGWKPEIYFSNQTANTQSFIINDTTSTYYVIARSADGCIDTASVKTEVDNKDFFIPNAFTPNNDGKNDLFRVYGSSVTAAEIKIYNQWGVMLYETKDNQKGWDGTHKNNPQPVGLYVYVVKVRLSNEDTFIKKGTIRLIR